MVGGALGLGPEGETKLWSTAARKLAAGKEMPSRLVDWGVGGGVGATATASQVAELARPCQSSRWRQPPQPQADWSQKRDGVAEGRGNEEVRKLEEVE